MTTKIDKQSIVILIPVYNEAKHLRAFLRDLKEYDHSVLVVDDGSTDDSAQIARDEGAEVEQVGRNRGKGHAMRKGFERALERGCSWVLVMDGDGQHSAKDISRFMEKAQKGSHEVIAGYRLHRPEGMSVLRQATNRFMSRLMTKLSKQKVHDGSCGFKMLSRNFLISADPRPLSVRNKKERWAPLPSSSMPPDPPGAGRAYP